MVQEDLVHVCRGAGDTGGVADGFVYFCAAGEKEGDGCGLVGVDGAVEYLTQLIGWDT